MEHYRLYLLGEGGRIIEGHDANCADDGGAMAQAAALLVDGGRVEVWCGTRLVGCVTVDLTKAGTADWFRTLRRRDRFGRRLVWTGVRRATAKAGRATAL